MSLEAFVTLATNDGYALGALVLAESIRKVGTQRQLVIMISNHLSDLIRKTLERSFDEVVVVEEMDSNDSKHLNLLCRPELGITFTKINCWLLEKYSKCVFLDSDCVVLRNIDDLFQREELSASPDAGWPDCFNSGVFVYQPSKETFTKLVQFANQQDASFDGGDQGLLNRFFSNWRTSDISRHLPFTYNVTANAFYSYLPAVTRFRNDIHIVHFAGAIKPWQLTYNHQSEQLSGNLGGHSDIQREFFLSWWRIMYQRVWPHLSKDNQEAISNNQSNIGGESQFGGQNLNSSLNYGSLTSDQGVQTGSAAHRRAWEAGHVDYYGRDSFSNIQQQLERNIAQHEQPYHPSQTRQTTPDNTTTQIKSALKKTTPPPQLQQTTNLPKSLPKEETPPQPQQATTTTKTTTVITTTLPISSLDEAIPPPPQQTTTTATTITHSNNSLKEETTTLPKTLLKQATPATTTTATTAHSNNSLKEETTILPKTLLEKATPVQEHTTSAPKSSNKETTSSLSSSHLPLSNGSILPTEHTSSASEHETSWKVKSTIVTSYTQGVGGLAGPTVVSKTVTESSASSSNDIPTVTSINGKTDSRDSSVLSVTAKSSNDHFAWFFDKLFVAITYTISLCYLVFLVTLRRSKDTNINHDNVTSVRGATSKTNNVNRVNK